MDGCNGTRRTDTTALPVDCSTSLDGVSPADEGELLDPPLDRGFTGNLTIDVMLLCERTQAKRQRSAETQREAADALQTSAEDRQVEKMREEARDTFAQAMVSCAFSLAASGAQAASGGLQINAGGLQGDAAVFSKQAGVLGARAAQATGQSRIWDAVGTGINGIGAAVAGAQNKTIKEDQADAKELEHAAARAGRRGSADGEASREMKELAAKTMQRLEQLIDAEHQTRLALIQRA